MWIEQRVGMVIIGARERSSRAEYMFSISLREHSIGGENYSINYNCVYYEIVKTENRRERFNSDTCDSNNRSSLFAFFL